MCWAKYAENNFESNQVKKNILKTNTSKLVHEFFRNCGISRTNETFK